MAQHYGPNIVTDGLVLCLDAADKNSYPGSGTTWTDISGNGNDATLVNGPTYNSSPGYIDLDGTNDYISLSTSVSVTSFSVEFWVQFQDFIDGYLWILDNSDNPELRIAVSSNTPGLLVYDDGAYAMNTTTATTLLSDTWYQLVLTITNNDFRFYINDSLDVSDTSGTYNGGGVGEHTLGTYNRPGTGYGGYRNSKYAIFRYYNRVLTAAEVSQNFNAQRSRFGM